MKNREKEEQIQYNNNEEIEDDEKVLKYMEKDTTDTGMEKTKLKMKGNEIMEEDEKEQNKRLKEIEEERREYQEKLEEERKKKEENNRLEKEKTWI